jgi:hypothetical protein
MAASTSEAAVRSFDGTVDLRECTEADDSTVTFCLTKISEVGVVLQMSVVPLGAAGSDALQVVVGVTRTAGNSVDADLEASVLAALNEGTGGCLRARSAGSGVAAGGSGVTIGCSSSTTSSVTVGDHLRCGPRTRCNDSPKMLLPVRVTELGVRGPKRTDHRRGLAVKSSRPSEVPVVAESAGTCTASCDVVPALSSSVIKLSPPLAMLVLGAGECNRAAMAMNVGPLRPNFAVGSPLCCGRHAMCRAARGKYWIARCRRETAELAA